MIAHAHRLATPPPPPGAIRAAPSGGAAALAGSTVLGFLIVALPLARGGVDVWAETCVVALAIAGLVLVTGGGVNVPVPAAALSAVDPRLVEASHALGVSRLATLFRVSLPLARNGIVTGAVLAFAHTLGEFGVVLMVGGNLPGETRTLSIALYDHVEALEYGAANRTAAFLLAISFAVLVLVHALQRSPLLRWKGRWEL